MGPNSSTVAARRDYLVVYDYGMGGLWAYIKAASEADILRTFPQLTVMAAKPVTVQDDRDFNSILERNRYDIDDPSSWSEWLTSLEDKPAQ